MSGPGATARARGALARALRGAVDRGEGVPCLHPTRGAAWTSDDPDDLAAAAEACGPCPVLDACRAAGAHELWGAWGGRVRMRSGPGPREPKPPKPQLWPVVLLALATASKPLTSAVIAHDVAPLLGFTPSVVSVGAAVSVLTARGHAVNRATRDVGRFEITDAGRAAAEGLGAFATRDTG